MAGLSETTSTDFVRKILLIAAICTPLGVLFLMYLHFSASGRLPYLIEHYASSILIMNVFGGIVYVIDYWLDGKISWREAFLSRLICGLAANVAIVIPSAIFLSANFTSDFRPDTAKIAVLLIISLFIYEIAYGWFYSFRYYAHTQVERLRLERWQLELQFESLKNQISPHFLFNCLNTISSLLYKDVALTEEFIRRMADTFRYVLKNHKERFVSLKEEIEFVKSYHYLLRVRFEDNFKLEINVAKDLMSSPVPPLTLQLLVENAVKHNKVSKDNPLTVTISSPENTRLVVANTKTDTVVKKAGFAIGLENIKKRYAFFTKEQVVVKNEDEFSVQLPILKSGSNA
ncbi:histidine kinase [Cytophagales bacterium WSM2-2]|nr:histidine kinase [Cytophagales bacterium WSM2-2]